MPPKRSRKRKSRKGFKQRVQSTVLAMADTKNRNSNAINLGIQTAASGSPLEFLMTNIAQGTGDHDRVGSRILATGIYMQGQITMPDSTNLVRCIVYVRKGPYTLNPIQYKGVEVNSFFDPSGYQILRDFVISGGANGPVCKNIRVALSFKNRKEGGIPVEFASSSATSTTNNMIGIYLVSDSGATSHPVLNGYNVMYYKDF